MECVGASIARPLTWRSIAFSGTVSYKENGYRRAMLAPTNLPKGRNRPVKFFDSLGAHYARLVFFFRLNSTLTPTRTSSKPIPLNSSVPKPPVTGSVKPLRLMTSMSLYL